MKEIFQSFTPESNRDKILLAGFVEMYQNGFQGMRIEAVLKATGLAKGALYHHFPHKKTLAYAIVDELLYKFSNEQFAKILNAYDDPLTAIQKTLLQCTNDLTEEDISLGCPINNLAQEMSGLDQGFKERINQIYCSWHQTLLQALKSARDSGMIATELKLEDIALFIVCSTQGITGAAKCMQSKDVMVKQTEILCSFVEGLRKK